MSKVLMAILFSILVLLTTGAQGTSTVSSSTAASSSATVSTASTSTSGTAASTSSATTPAAAGGGGSTFNYTMSEPTLAQYGPGNWSELAKKIIDLLAWIVGSIFVGVLLVGGVMIITAGGNETQAESGKKAVFAAIIGVAVVAMAWTVVSFIAGMIK